MGVVSFTYPKPTKSIGGFEIDVFLDERYSYGNKITELPLEDGCIVSDHVVEEVDEISIQAFISRAKMAAWEGPLPESDGDLPKENPKARILQKYNELLRLKRERQPITVVTGLGTFPSMVISKFDIDRNVETGADLAFDMAFKRVKIVKSETTTITATPNTPEGDQVAGTANQGTVGTAKTDPASLKAKEEWRSAVREGTFVSTADYEEKWGVPYPQ
jgi:hypothetical protein